MTKTYKISEIAKITGFSIPTLRYYEDLGLIKPERSTSNYRTFTEKDLHWIEFIQRAKMTGMPLEDIKAYSDLREKGDSTIIERLSLLIKQEHILREKKQELESHIDFLQKKKQTYYELLEKKNSD
ncbi:MerR family transcriptional regulator [Lactococcus nasutitermitis]|uniref:MerR family transcriptional regulator n=1 Tax=Lactococcus nasutitermitis TaxID=1652957 RepID=A0ABV9JC61_9LACT|nr:MerR family transcriptional regulator [Lactococcus nasutitermitis]